MKFPNFSTTLKLLKPFAKPEAKSYLPSDSNLTLYDQIEEIVSIVNYETNGDEILNKFFALSEIQQQLTLVTLIEHSLVETLEVILQSEFDVNFLIKGQTPLHFAIKTQNLYMTKVLIKYKADLEIKDIYKETALNCAVRTGNIEIIKCLLEKGAEVNTQASDSNTPLEVAIHQGDIDSVNILEQYGASLDASIMAIQK